MEFLRPVLDCEAAAWQHQALRVRRPRDGLDSEVWHDGRLAEVRNTFMESIREVSSIGGSPAAQAPAKEPGSLAVESALTESSAYATSKETSARRGDAPPALRPLVLSENDADPSPDESDRQRWRGDEGAEERSASCQRDDSTRRDSARGSALGRDSPRGACDQCSTLLVHQQVLDSEARQATVRVKLRQSEATRAWGDMEAVEKGTLAQKAQLRELRARLETLRAEFALRSHSGHRAGALRARSLGRAALLEQELAAAKSAVKRLRREGIQQEVESRRACEAVQAHRTSVVDAVESLRLDLTSALGRRAGAMLGGARHALDLVTALEGAARNLVADIRHENEEERVVPRRRVKEEQSRTPSLPTMQVSDEAIPRATEGEEEDGELMLARRRDVSRKTPTWTGFKLDINETITEAEGAAFCRQNSPWEGSSNDPEFPMPFAEFVRQTTKDIDDKRLGCDRADAPPDGAHHPHAGSGHDRARSLVKEVLKAAEAVSAAVRSSPPSGAARREVGGDAEAGAKATEPIAVAASGGESGNAVQLQQPWAVGTVHLSMTVCNVDFSKLAADAVMSAKFQTEVKLAIASETGVLIRPEDLSLATRQCGSSSAILVQAFVAPASFGEAPGFLSRVRSAQTGLAWSVLGRLLSLDGIASCSRGPVSIVSMVANPIGAAITTTLNTAAVRSVTPPRLVAAEGPSRTPFPLMGVAHHGAVSRGLSPQPRQHSTVTIGAWGSFVAMAPVGAAAGGLAAGAPAASAQFRAAASGVSPCRAAAAGLSPCRSYPGPLPAAPPAPNFYHQHPPFVFFGTGLHGGP
mmetsp:Transcript_107745/g.343914  ORF Transcript_107745/g.343914 Transcript_107745/m.343914 type:complete len:810 (-) Transcript_107745:29-2458(-)